MFEPLQRARYAWLALSLVVIYAFWHRLTLIAAGSDSDFDAYARFVRRRRLHVE